MEKWYEIWNQTGYFSLIVFDYIIWNPRKKLAKERKSQNIQSYFILLFYFTSQE